MRHEPAAPALAAIDLLARADSLALMAELAIGAGDTAALDAILVQRGEAISAAIAAWRDSTRQRPDPALEAQVARAAQATVASGQHTKAVATIARDQASAELTALEARQQAAHEYQPDPAGSRLDVVL
jgi:hypothetical protein